MAYTWQGCYRRRSPNWGERKAPPPHLRTLGIFDPLNWGSRGLGVGVFNCGLTAPRSTLTLPPVVHDWVNKGLGMSSRVCATGHIKDPVPELCNMEKSRALCSGGRFPPSFIHQVMMTALNKLYDCMALDANRA